MIHCTVNITKLKKLTFRKRVTETPDDNVWLSGRAGSLETLLNNWREAGLLKLTYGADYTVKYISPEKRLVDRS